MNVFTKSLVSVTAIAAVLLAIAFSPAVQADQPESPHILENVVPGERIPMVFYPHYDANTDKMGVCVVIQDAFPMLVGDCFYAGQIFESVREATNNLEKLKRKHPHLFGAI